MDDRARTRLQIRLVLVIWRRELRRLAESVIPADVRAARESELRERALNVLRITADHVEAVVADAADTAELARALREIDGEK